MSILIFLLGVILFLLGSAFFLIAAFSVSIWWFIGCLLLPIIQLAFAIFHWKKARKGFLILVAGIALMLVGAFMTGSVIGKKIYEGWQEFRHSGMDEASRTVVPVEVCDGRTQCSEMTSCPEAIFFMKKCPDTKLDADGNGVPCESEWCRY